MSKTPRQHWQENNKDYTVSQYAFYLVVLGLLIAGLLIGYLILMRGPAVPVTHVVSIISQPGGELPVIPFQNEDSAALAALLENYKRYDFNDIASFDQDVIEKLKTDFAGNQDIDTVIVWLSAIGTVKNGSPVILGSEPGEAIEFDHLISQLNELKAENIILLLDCGHAYVVPDAYTDNSHDTDFNSFADVVGSALENGTGKVNVLLNAQPGERPMYSTTRRRSLFGHALETIFSQNENPVWTSTEFEQSLDDICLQFGGTSTPHLNWLGSEASFRRPMVIPSDDDAEEEQQDPDRVEFTPDASKMAEELNKAWSAFRRTRNRLAISPEIMDPASWHSMTFRLIGFAADELQFSLRDVVRSCQKVPLDLQDLEESLLEPVQHVAQRLNLIPDPDAETEPAVILDKRMVAKSFLRVNELEQRLPHYVAMADSLSWIFPAEDAVEKLRTNTIQLVELFGDVNRPTDFSSILRASEPSLDQFDDINRASDRLMRSEDRLLKRLNFIFRNVVTQTNGFQREMAVEAVLRMPFLVAEKPHEISPEMKDEDRLWSREEMQEMLATNPINKYSRIDSSDRVSASARRIELYRETLAALGSPAENNSASLRLQTFAYRLPVTRFEVKAFVVRDRAPKIRVMANNRNALENGENYIERETTVLDLGLDVDNTQVLVRCQLIQDDKYFSFPGSSSSEHEFEGNPELIALQDSLENDPECKLSVSIVDRNNPSNEYVSFNIPIRLPSKDVIELIADVGGRASVVRRNSIGDPIRPFPNRKDRRFELGLRNQWHRKRAGTISLYACASPDTRTIIGKINRQVMQRTMLQLENKSLQEIATSKFELPAATGDATGPVKIIWRVPGEEEETPPVQADYGFLCVIENEGRTENWYYWIPVFPLENPVVSVLPVMDESGSLALSVKRQQFCPRDMPVTVGWRFSDNQIKGGTQVIGAESGEITIPLARNVAEQLKQGSFLYVDIDNWPRKFVFEFTGSTFAIATTNNAEIDVQLGQPGDAQTSETGLVGLEPANGFLRFGTASEDHTLTVTLKPNVPSVGDAFLFATAADHIRLFETGDAYELYYPWQISNHVSLAAKTGTLFLESRVTDYQLAFSDIGRVFEIAPVLNLDQRERTLDGPNRIQVQFDREPPRIGDVRVRNTGEIYPTQPVRISVEADDGEGVGIATVDVFLSDRNGSLRELSGKPCAAKRVGDGTFEIEAPEKPGKYTVGVRVADVVGNSAEELSENRVNFEVVQKPVVPGESKPVTPVVYRHTLIVTVTNHSIVTQPEIVIKPEDASPERTNDGQYVFKDLNGGVQYTISAKARIASGVAKGDELKASLTVKFPKTATGPQTIQKSIKLER